MKSWKKYVLFFTCVSCISLLSGCGNKEKDAGNKNGITESGDIGRDETDGAADPDNTGGNGSDADNGMTGQEDDLVNDATSGDTDDADDRANPGGTAGDADGNGTDGNADPDGMAGDTAGNGIDGDADPDGTAGDADGTGQNTGRAGGTDRDGDTVIQDLGDAGNDLLDGVGDAGKSVIDGIENAGDDLTGNHTAG